VPRRTSRWIDRIIGVLLGVALGLGVIVLFVFEGSEGTIDAPRISGIQHQGRSGQGGGGQRLPLVRIVDSKPPPSGPVLLDFRQGEPVRFAVDSNTGVGIAIEGYGVDRLLGPGRSVVAFRADKPGQFPVVVSESKISVATMRVTPR
jgi:hypothetical protein